MKAKKRGGRQRKLNGKAMAWVFRVVTSSPQRLKSLVLAGMTFMAISLKTGLSLARSERGMRYSHEMIFDYVISRLVALRKLTELADIRPDLRHLRGQKRKRMSLNCGLMELLG